MAIVRSLGELVNMDPPWTPAPAFGSLSFYDQYAYDYATLYSTQPNVRTCVDFLARNIAQLGLHVFRRKGETDRQRLRDHPLAQLIGRPLPPACKLTYYGLIEGLMGDLGIYYSGFWLKVRPPNGNLGLLPVPPTLVSVYGNLFPARYEINLGGQVLNVPPEQMVHFRGYNPLNRANGLSPLETLRRVLAEEHAAGEYREGFWANGARMYGVIERPVEAPEWSKDARERFKAQFEALYAGTENSGRTAILEEGMTWKETTFNAQESEYLAGRKLTREECARAYHIPLPMVGILDHATFSNIKEQHKQLYQDALGPWLAMLEQDIELQLLPEFDDTEGVYVEFNIAEKLQGSFEEQTTSLQSAVGRPYMTADEARARMNLPSMGGDAGQLVTPLNVIVGGQASPRDSAPPKGHTHTKAADDTRIDPTQPELRRRHEEKWSQVLGAYFERQRDSILGHVPEKGYSKASTSGIWDGARWDQELQVALYRMGVATASVWAKFVTDQAGAELDADLMLPWIEETTGNAAEGINGMTREELERALDDEDPRSAVRELFRLAITWRAIEIARTMVTRYSTFGSQEGAKQAGLKKKTWKVNSANPRPEHAAMAGETVGIHDLFSNGMMWPGDPAGGAENNSNCACSVTFGR